MGLGATAAVAAVGIAAAAGAIAIAAFLPEPPPTEPPPPGQPAAGPPAHAAALRPMPPLPGDAPPLVLAVRAASPDGLYGAGETVLIEVVFSENVTAAGAAPPPNATVVIMQGLLDRECGGGLDRACYSDGEVRVRVGSTVTWVNNDTSPHFMMGIAPDGRHMPAFYSGGVDPGSAFSYTFDEPGDYGFYSGMNALEAGVVRVEALDPILALDTGCTGRNATYAAPGGPGPAQSDTLRFEYAVRPGDRSADLEYAVRPGDRSADLEYAGTGALSAARGIVDAAGNAADLALPARGSPGSLSAGADISVLAPMRPHMDDVPPCVLAVRSASPDGSYGAGETVLIDVVFSENVTAAGAGVPPVAGDAVVRMLPGSSLPDCAGACYSDREVRIELGRSVAWINADAGAHTVASGTVAGGPGGLFDSGLMDPGSEFRHAFGEPGTYPYLCVLHPWMAGAVHVGRGAPILALDAGGTEGRNAAYAAPGGPGPAQSDTLRFEYTVRPGDRSADLEYAGTGALSAIQGIVDAAGNAADLALPARGSPGSLSASSDVSVSG